MCGGRAASACSSYHESFAHRTGSDITAPRRFWREEGEWKSTITAGARDYPPVIPKRRGDPGSNETPRDGGRRGGRERRRARPRHCEWGAPSDPTAEPLSREPGWEGRTT